MVEASRVGQALGPTPAGRDRILPEAIVRDTSPAPEALARHSYFDPTHRAQALKLMPGEYGIVTGGQMLTTVLGSCVSACVRDRSTGIGGMNHFLLPDAAAGQSAGVARYGSFAMDTMISHLMRLGARAGELEAKVFGGGAVLAGMTHLNVGDRNARFVIDYLEELRIPILGADLGSAHPRRVIFFPSTGKVLLKRLPVSDTNALIQREDAFHRRLVLTQPGAVIGSP